MSCIVVCCYVFLVAWKNVHLVGSFSISFNLVNWNNDSRKGKERKTYLKPPVRHLATAVCVVSINLFSTKLSGSLSLLRSSKTGLGMPCYCSPLKCMTLEICASRPFLKNLSWEKPPSREVRHRARSSLITKADHPANQIDSSIGWPFPSQKTNQFGFDPTNQRRMACWECKYSKPKRISEK